MSALLGATDALALLADLPDTLDREQAGVASRAAGSLLYHRLPDLPSEFTPRDVYWSRWRGLDSPALATKAIAHLVQQGVLTQGGSRSGMPLYLTAEAVSAAGTTPRATTPAAGSGTGAVAPEARVTATYRRDRNKWLARTWRNGKRVSLGVYATREEAEAA